MEDYSEETAPVMSLGEWALTIFITFIPILGFIMLIYWSVSSTTNPNKQNWAKAMLIIYFIVLLLYLIFGVALFNAFMPVG